MIWPYFIGILSILFGVPSALSLLTWLLASIEARGLREHIPDPLLDHFLVALVVPVLFIFLYVWLVVGGLGLVLRKQFGAWAMRKWARVVILSVITCDLFLVVMLFVGANQVSQEQGCPITSSQVAWAPLSPLCS